jgi:hypothetical protein
MSIPIPSLTLAFEKKTSTNLTNTNDNSNKNVINLNLYNNIDDTYTPNNSPIGRSMSPKILSPRAVIPHSNTPKPNPNRRRSSVFSPYPKNISAPVSEILAVDSMNRRANPEELELEEDVENYKSPTFEQVEVEFKDCLISFTTDLLLNSSYLIKNIAKVSNKIVFKEEQLKQLIAILYLNKDDRKKYNELIEIDVEPVVMNNCLCNYKNPFYMKIKSIVINKSVSFLHHPLATNLSSVFRIGLEHVIKEQK